MYDVGLEDFLAGGVKDVGPIVLFGDAARVDFDVCSLVGQGDDGFGRWVLLVGKGKVGGAGRWAVLVVDVDGEHLAVNGDGGIAGGGGGTC